MKEGLILWPIRCPYCGEVELVEAEELIKHYFLDFNCVRCGQSYCLYPEKLLKSLVLKLKLIEEQG